MGWRRWSATEPTRADPTEAPWDGSKHGSTWGKPKNRISDKTRQGVAVEMEGVENRRAVFPGRGGRGRRAPNIFSLCVTLIEVPVLART